MEVFTKIFIACLEKNLDENFFCGEINFPFKKLKFFLEQSLLVGLLRGFFSELALYLIIFFLAGKQEKGGKGTFKGPFHPKLFYDLMK